MILLDAHLLPALLIALLAGGLSFLSPCVLPIVPPYLAYMGGLSAADLGTRAARRALLLPALLFVLGLSTVFMLMGVAASAIGMAFLRYQGWLNTLAGLMVMGFGLHFLGVLRLTFLEREARLQAGPRGGSALGAYILGLAFAFGWTPCIGPQLGAILTLAAVEASATRGGVLLAFYALGLGLPFLLVAAFLPWLGGVMGWARQHLEQIERLAGLLLWTVGLLMLTGGFSAMSYWLLEVLPALGRMG